MAGIANAISHWVSFWRLFAGSTVLSAVAATANAGICSGTQATTTVTPATYTAFLVTDVSLGSHVYHQAAVTFTYHGNTRDIYNFATTASDGNTGGGMCLEKGNATVSIATASETVTAEFVPGQLVVSFDTQNGGIGFSSYTGPNGFEPAYPLGFLLGTVGQFTSDLFTPISMSGIAWSCIGYPPILNSGFCLDPAPYPLKTNHGDFRIYMPYQYLNPTTGYIAYDFHGSLNRGTFSVIVGK